MRIQYTTSNAIAYYDNQPNVTACYLLRSEESNSQLFVHFKDEKIIFEAFDSKGISLGYIGNNDLTHSMDKAVVQQGHSNIILHDCDHVEWVKKVVLH